VSLQHMIPSLFSAARGVKAVVLLEEVVVVRVEEEARSREER
jgi:hypothetical protein